MSTGIKSVGFQRPESIPGFGRAISTGVDRLIVDNGKTITITNTMDITWIKADWTITDPIIVPSVWGIK